MADNARGGRLLRDVEQVFLERIRACGPGALTEGAAVLLGCSAGGDSMALLHLAAGAATASGWRLHVAHFDHAQRPESRDEAEFVRRAALNAGAEFHTARLGDGDQGGPDGDARRGLNEDAMRNARLDFFASVYERVSAAALLLAHQADDRAETFLMRLIAGSGPTGLASIRPVEEVRGMRIVRPLLGVRRAELRDRLRASGVAWLEDPSNEDERHKRVWVRRRVMPLFDERMGTDVTARIARMCETADEESGALNEAADLMLEMIRAEFAAPALGAIELRHPLWKGASRDLRRTLLRRWIWRLRAPPFPPGRDALEEALDFAERGKGGGAKMRTVDALRLEKREGVLTLLPAAPSESTESDAICEGA